ncbi:MAG: radical SAM protein [Candidatus Aenigmatarchaeota archaeon]
MFDLKRLKDYVNQKIKNSLALIFLMYDAIELSKIIERQTTEKVEGKTFRKYYRFRPAKFYGGIASADCVGCNLRCVYCWSNDLAREGKIGKFYSPEEVASKLKEIAKKFGFKQARITGNEPTISREHLISVLEEIPKNLTFILETNGILLGADESYVKDLKKFENLYVRISLKGCDEVDFSRLTGAKPEEFKLQLQALEYCLANDIPCHPAILIDLVDKNKISSLKKKLREIDDSLPEKIEFESLIVYPHVSKRLKGLKINSFNSLI